MDAVNLIPDAGGQGRLSVATSPQTLALIAGLAVVLIATLLYVSVDNQVTARKSDLALATANAATWQRAAGSVAPYVAAAQQRSAQLAAVRQLVGARFGWSRLLGQIAQALPAASGLSSVQASTAGGDASAPTSTQPSVQLAGCAASQSTVALAMEQLRRVDGVSTVVLGSTSDTSTGPATGAASSAAGASSGGSCAYPVQFQLSLTLDGTSAGAAAVSTGQVPAQ